MTIEIEFRWYLFVAGYLVMFAGLMLLVFGQIKWGKIGRLGALAFVPAVWLIALSVVDELWFATAFGIPFGILLAVVSHVAATAGFKMRSNRR